MKTLTPDTSPAALLLAILFPEDTTNGTDGDDWSAASLETPIQRLFNRIEKNRLDLVTALGNIATLQTALNALTVLNSDDDANTASALADIVAHVADLTAAHQATAIAVQAISGVTGSNTQVVLENLRGQIGVLEGIGAASRLTALEAARAAQTFGIAVADNPGYVGSSGYGDSANTTTALGNFVVPAAFWGKRVLIQVSSVNVRSLTFGNSHLYVRHSGVSSPYPAGSFAEVSSYAPQSASLFGSYSGAVIMTLPNAAHDLHLEFTDTNAGGIGDLDPQLIYVTLFVL